MFGRRFPLVHLFGFEVRFDLSWLILLALVIWTLSVGYFPRAFEDLPASTYGWMALAAAIGLFASIVFHELAHSLVGRRVGMQIKGITLFAFGGAAEMSDEPRSPKAEFLMAAAGPASSLVLAGVLYLVGLGLRSAGVSDLVIGVVVYLAGINAILALFNLIPAYPLDGGRILRSALWAWRGSIGWATRIAAGLGGLFGLVLVALGVLNVVAGGFVGGMWLVLIGLFLRAVASRSYQETLAHRSLEGLQVRHLMNTGTAAASADLPLPDLIEDYILGRYMETVPIVESNRLAGVVRLKDVKAVDAGRRASLRARDVVGALPHESIVDPETGAQEALSRMQKADLDRLFVVRDGALVGTLALVDLLRYLKLRLELDEDIDHLAARRSGASAPDEGPPWRHAGHR